MHTNLSKFFLNTLSVVLHDIKFLFQGLDLVSEVLYTVLQLLLLFLQVHNLIFQFFVAYFQLLNLQGIYNQTIKVKFKGI